MNRKLLLSISALLMAAASYGGTISGTVYYQGGPSTAGPYQIVSVWDTGHTWSTTVMTNYDGVYSVAIPSSIPTTGPGSYITVAVDDRPADPKKVVVNSGNPVADFDIGYTSSPISELGGFLQFATHPSGMSGSPAPAKFYLVRKWYDPVVADTVLTALDSFTTTHPAGVFARPYTVRPRGFLLLKAALEPANTEYANYLPTYSGANGALRPVNVMPLRTDVFIKGFTTTILMTRAVNPGGPGFIGGQISLGANKTAGVGDPVPNRSIMLTTSSGAPVAHTVSDASGRFQFPSLAYGTYQLFGDVFDKANPVLTVTISAAKPRVANVLFEENDKRFSGRISNVGVGKAASLTMRLYPNPAAAHCKVEFSSGFSGNVLVSDMLGRTLKTVPVAGQRDVQLEIEDLPAAVYQVRCIGDNGEAGATMRLTKE